MVFSLSSCDSDSERRWRCPCHNARALPLARMPSFRRTSPWAPRARTNGGPSSKCGGFVRVLARARRGRARERVYARRVGIFGHRSRPFAIRMYRQQTRLSTVNCDVLLKYIAAPIPSMAGRTVPRMRYLQGVVYRGADIATASECASGGGSEFTWARFSPEELQSWETR